MQELFFKKIKFLSMSKKPALHQLKNFTSSRITVQASLTALISLSVSMGKYPMFRTNAKFHQLITDAKISYSIVSLVFCKFSYRTY